ncbi:MAG: PEP-CTERM sorting domain-containing protein [Phycisphaerales bacterium]
MPSRPSILTLAAIAAPALAPSTAAAQDALTPFQPAGAFVFRVDDAGNAVCNYEPGFMFDAADASASVEPLFCALYIDGVLQPPYPGFHANKPRVESSTQSAIPAPGAGALLLLAAGATTARRRR